MQPTDPRVRAAPQERTARRARAVIGLLLAGLAVSRLALAEEPACPLANQTPMLVTQLIFGPSIPGRRPVTPTEWRRFVRRELTPRFPEGFTVYDGQGQWLDPATHIIVREQSKIVIIAAQDTAEVRARLAEVADLYRRAFHQQSVGTISSRTCAGF